MKLKDEEIRDMLRQAMPPADSELNADLWPRMLRRLDEGSGRMVWFDRILLLAVPVAMALFPAVIPQLLYQL